MTLKKIPDLLKLNIRTKSLNPNTTSQGVIFPAGLQVLPIGNLGISQEIQPKCLSVLSKIRYFKLLFVHFFGPNGGILFEKNYFS